MAKKIDVNGLDHYHDKVSAMLASEYSSSKTYAVGDYCFHAGTLYECTTAITTAENWTSGHWTAAKLAEDTSALKTAFMNYVPDSLLKSATGTLISFDDGVNGGAIKKISAQINPIQSGSGSPSPDNIRNISGFSSVNIVVSPTTNSEDGTTYEISFPSSAGTVYGGSLEVHSDGTGTLTVDRGFWSGKISSGTVDGTSGGYKKYGFYPTIGGVTSPGTTTNKISNIAPYLYADNYTSPHWYNNAYGKVTLYVPDTVSTDTTVQFVMSLATPQTYELTAPQVLTLLGKNYIWSNVGEISIEYGANTEIILEDLKETEETLVDGASKKSDKNVGKNLANIWYRDRGITQSQPVLELDKYYVGYNSTLSRYEALVTYFDVDNANKAVSVKSSSGYGVCFLLPAKPNTQYTISYQRTHTDSGVNIGFLDSSKSSISQTSDATFTTPENTAYVFVVFNTYSTASTYCTFSNIQIEEGASATTYEDYQLFDNTSSFWGVPNKEKYLVVQDDGYVGANDSVYHDSVFYPVLYKAKSARYEYYSVNLLHFSDLHGDKAALQRISHDLDMFGDAVDDAICTGDMLWTQAEQISSWWDERIMTVVGNHDSCSYNSSTGFDWTALSMANRDAYYIAPFESNWNIVHTSGTSYYYKDYANQKLRLVVMDVMLYNDAGAEATAQNTWLGSVLDDAITNNYHVLIAIHAPHGGATSTECLFGKYGSQRTMPVNEDGNTPSSVIELVADKIESGLTFVGYLVGHTHQDDVWNADGQLMYTISCAAESYDGQWQNSDLYRSERESVYNIVSVDTIKHRIRIIRGGGANMDRFTLRPRNTICFDYTTGDIVSED